MTHFVSAEEERRVRANDREYNEKFQYAVRQFPSLPVPKSHSLSLKVRGCSIFKPTNGNIVKVFICFFFFLPPPHPE